MIEFEDNLAVIVVDELDGNHPVISIKDTPDKVEFDRALVHVAS